MFVWFERSGQHVRVEVLELSPKNYELRFIDADGLERVEMLTDSGALASRVGTSIRDPFDGSERLTVSAGSLQNRRWQSKQR
jgi:hypothetical protein